MTSEWHEVPLRELVGYISKGIAPSYAEEASESTIRVLNQKCNRNFRISYGDSRLHDTRKKKVPPERCVKPDDILINSTGAGTAGRIAQIEDVPSATTIDGHMILIRSNGKVTQKFLGYALKAHQWEVLQLDEGSTGQTELNRDRLLDEIMINYPVSLDEQNAIVGTLESIDRKLIVNEQLNDNLQQQAFSVFDNLIANAENNDCTVSDYAFLNPKRTLAKNQVSRSIDMSQLSTSGAFPSGWEMKPFNGGMRFTNGDTLLARITPCLENGKTAFIDFLDDGEVAFGSTEYIVLAPKNDTPPEMLYCLARYPAFVDYAVKNMNGSSGRQRVSAETVGQYRLPLFDKHSLVLFKEVVSPMFLKMRYNSLENMRLAELRDALLPKLMSSEINVSAVQL